LIRCSGERSERIELGVDHVEEAEIPEVPSLQEDGAGLFTAQGLQGRLRNVLPRDGRHRYKPVPTEATRSMPSAWNLPFRGRIPQCRQGVGPDARADTAAGWDSTGVSIFHPVRYCRTSPGSTRLKTAGSKTQRRRIGSSASASTSPGVPPGCRRVTDRVVRRGWFRFRLMRPAHPPGVPRTRPKGFPAAGFLLNRSTDPLVSSFTHPSAPRPCSPVCRRQSFPGADLGFRLTLTGAPERQSRGEGVDRMEAEAHRRRLAPRHWPGLGRRQVGTIPTSETPPRVHPPGARRRPSGSPARSRGHSGTVVFDPEKVGVRKRGTVRGRVPLGAGCRAGAGGCGAVQAAARLWVEPDQPALGRVPIGVGPGYLSARIALRFDLEVGKGPWRRFSPPENAWRGDGRFRTVRIPPRNERGPHPTIPIPSLKHRFAVMTSSSFAVHRKSKEIMHV
jgi:hypothetical protein